jgi:hypothetical protein
MESSEIWVNDARSNALILKVKGKEALVEEKKKYPLIVDFIFLEINQISS